LGVRLRDEPEGVHRFLVARGSVADGSNIRELPLSFDDVWISFVIRGGELVPVRGSTTLQSGDDVLVLADPRHHDALAEAFTQPGQSTDS
jgi:cell volume regulation protein A